MGQEKGASLTVGGHTTEYTGPQFRHTQRAPFTIFKATQLTSSATVNREIEKREVRQREEVSWPNTSGLDSFFGGTPCQSTAAPSTTTSCSDLPRVLDADLDDDVVHCPTTKHPCRPLLTSNQPPRARTPAPANQRSRSFAAPTITSFF